MLPAALLCPSSPPAATATTNMQGELTQGLVLTNTGRGMPPLSLPSLLQQTKALHVDHQRDGPDLLMIAYDRGTLSKVIEFVDFDERLERSYVRAACQVEHALLQMRTALLGGAPLATAAAAAAAQAAAVVERVSPLAACTFNEDWSTRPSWLPPATEGAAWALLQWWDTQDSCLGQALGADGGVMPVLWETAFVDVGMCSRGLHHGLGTLFLGGPIMCIYSSHSYTPLHAHANHLPQPRLPQA